MTETAIVSIIVAILSFVGTLSGSYYSSKKSYDLIEYRLQQLEEQVQKHNNLIDRTYKLEEQAAVHTEQINDINKRLKA